MLIECVPNFSEGRRPEVIQKIVSAIDSVAGVRVLHQTSDPDHNRTVVTFAGDMGAVEEAAFRGIAEAAHLIDMRQHQGVHPRIGAADVVPFVPLEGATMEDCVQLAHRVGRRVADELNISVYMYAEAATNPTRRDLADIRRGQYEGLAISIQNDPARKPDYGPAELGSAGATAIGARGPLIAFNVYLSTDDVQIARAIARAIRHSSGGLRYVKAMGVPVRGRAQVSMNLTDFTRTPVYRVVEMIRREAARYGVTIVSSEVIGLIPQSALFDAAQWYLQIEGDVAQQVLEGALATFAQDKAEKSAP